MNDETMRMVLYQEDLSFYISLQQQGMRRDTPIGTQQVLDYERYLCKTYDKTLPQIISAARTKHYTGLEDRVLRGDLV